ncbi:MAG: ABC transporter substrate-binding protein [Clostridia bacterium]|nr:ABC transporter substrate-binding protein [Clostridia bacterium]
MKKLISIILIALVSVFAFASCSDTDTDSDVYKVGVVQYISHPSLDNCYAGVEQALTARFGDKVEITRQIGSDSSADSDCSTYASQYAAQNYDMIVAIATPAASSAFAAAEAKDIPVVFCAVSDPMSVGLVESMEKPGYNCSGTSDVLDMAAQIKLITSLQPDVKKIGVLYTSSEANSIAQLALLEAAAQPYGIEIVPQSIQNDADIPAAATALCAKVDCLNNFTDNKVVNNLTVVLEAANEANIPVYGSEVEQVKNGCLASVSIDYVALGKVTGDMAADALEGAKLADMAVKTISDATPVVNSEVLAAFGIELPASYANAEIVTTNK